MQIVDGKDYLSEVKDLIIEYSKRLGRDSIYVINVGGYIGESTKSEIEYARGHGKEINYFEPFS